MNTQAVVFEQDNKQVIQDGSKFFTRVFQDGENFESGDFNTLDKAKESLGIAPTITENNILIAEFMQYEFFDGDFKVPHSNKTSNSDFKEWCPTYWNDVLDSGGYLICPTNLMFHTDWNWLMEVVEKIEELEYTVNIYKTANTGVNYCEVNEPTQSGERCKSFQHSRESKIQAVYIACVEFIKWYNQQK